MLLVAEHYLNYPEDEQEYRLVKCIEQGNYEEVTKVYLFFGQPPWYTLMLQDKFIQFFTDTSKSFGFRDENGSAVYADPLFNEFEIVIRGFFAGQRYYLFKKERYTRMPTFYEYLVYKNFVITCPEKEEPQYISKLIRNSHGKAPQDMTADELASRIIYSFMVRFGSDFRLEMAQRGDIGYYLQLMKSKQASGYTE